MNRVFLIIVLEERGKNPSVLLEDQKWCCEREQVGNTALNTSGTRGAAKTRSVIE